MNFQDLQRVETFQTYLDLALRKGRESRAGMKRPGRKVAPIDVIKNKELLRLSTVNKTISRALNRILTRFPTLDHLPPFYLSLLKATLEYSQVKKSLGALNWAVGKVNTFTTLYTVKLKKARELSLVHHLPKEYVGRISSVMRQIADPLIYLEEVRKVMKRYPAIKTELPTVAIYGFPNVGKTTLLTKLTRSTPEINSYAFTTRNINVGNIRMENRTIQVVDTPGILDREKKMNSIEMQAELVLKHVANVIVYVYDLTEPYPLKDQKKLYARVRKQYPALPIIPYLSKVDILEAGKIAASGLKCLTDYKMVEKEILRRLRVR
ncbi:MAG: GTP-binding protein [DPANN group archaeon]|nr:GTP-binding protein [DPANN group archaeon]